MSDQSGVPVIESLPNIINLSDIEETDPVIAKLKKTGCLEKHYAVLECWDNYKDWRKCQQEVHDFRNCIVGFEKNKAAVTSK